MPPIRLSFALLAGLALPARAQDTAMTMRAERLGPGLVVMSGFTNGNILALSGPDGTLLVDAQSARRAPLADSVLAAMGAPPVRWIINTHYHGDHVDGDPLWRARGAGIIGQERLPVQMAKDTVITNWGEWHRTPADPAAFPTRTFRDTLSLEFDGQSIRLVHIPAAHTDGDAIVWLPDANLMHIGDLFEHGAPPFIDWWAGGRVEGMLAGVDWGLVHSDGATRIVPGHGAVGSRAELLAYREMLFGLAARVADGIRAGQSLADIQAAQPAAPWLPLLVSPRRAGQFVELLYLGLTQFESATALRRLDPRTPEARLPWLLGCWTMTRNGRTIEERWSAMADGSLSGRGRTLRNGAVVDSEVIRISAAGDTLVYTAHPAGQAEASFRAPVASDSSVRFSNPAHDFPTRVAYRRDGPAGLLAEIAGPSPGGERVIAFPYAAAVCRDD